MLELHNKKLNEDLQRVTKISVKILSNNLQNFSSNSSLNNCFNSNNSCSNVLNENINDQNIIENQKFDLPLLKINKNENEKENNPSIFSQSEKGKSNKNYDLPLNFNGSPKFCDFKLND